jgi:hypothetical protein
MIIYIIIYIVTSCYKEISLSSLDQSKREGVGLTTPESILTEFGRECERTRQSEVSHFCFQEASVTKEPTLRIVVFLKGFKECMGVWVGVGESENESESESVPNRKR